MPENIIAGVCTAAAWHLMAAPSSGDFSKLQRSDHSQDYPLKPQTLRSQVSMENVQENVQEQQNNGNQTIRQETGLWTQGLRDPFP